MVIFVMGVSGSGKSTVGAALAARLGVPYADGDDYHSAANKAKMASGVPLDDADREPWLLALNAMAREMDSVVIGCSALKERYRETLRRGLVDVRFVFLEVPRAELERRLRARSGHFMPASLLDSQLSALELPEEAVRVMADADVDTVVARVVTRLHG